MLPVIYKSLRKALNEDYATTIHIKLDASLTAIMVGNLTTTCYFLNESITKLQIIMPSFGVEDKKNISIEIELFEGIIDSINQMIFKANYSKVPSNEIKKLESSVIVVKSIILKKFPIN